MDEDRGLAFSLNPLGRQTQFHKLTITTFKGPLVFKCSQHSPMTRPSVRHAVVIAIFRVLLLKKAHNLQGSNEPNIGKHLALP